MKKTIISSVLTLIATCGWAQNSANDSICVFDGTVTNVPDGTVVYLSLPFHEAGPGAYKNDTITTVTIYKKYKKEKLADYLALDAQIRAASAKMYTAQYDAKNEQDAKAAADEAKAISKQQKALNLKYFSIISEFLKNRDFGPSYERELMHLTQDAYYADDEEKMDICRKLFAKVPKDYNSQLV